jgi:acetyltransferase-like isoleucine patch superfamily enzyme
MFAEGIEIWASDTHPVYQDGSIINPSRPIEIQPHVWLGTNVMVMKGAVIGEGSVIGMGSLVRGEIPSHCIAAGHPAKVIKTNIDWDKSALQC